MPDLLIQAGPYKLKGRLETEKAPLTCAAFLELLPFRENLLHVRWSGESTWVPLGGLHMPLPPENATTYPLPGEILLYPGGLSETEILIPYGRTQFGSKAGLLAGNHFPHRRRGCGAPDRHWPAYVVGRRPAHHDRSLR